MGFRFRRSFRLLPGIRVNLGKRGASLSVGVRGAHVTVGPTGTRTTVGVPGSGLSYTHLDKAASTPAPVTDDPARPLLGRLVVLVGLAIALALLAWFVPSH